MGFDAHLTVLYLGELRTERDEVDEYLEANNLNGLSAMVIRDSVDLFGPELTIPVLKVFPPVELWDLRKKVEHELWNESQFKVWNPHITLDFDSAGTIHIPEYIKLREFGLY